ncbi:MAG: hypothetical protein E4H07_04260 [Nitrosomonadales bacterium]|nr:MAG: hypothetical protein E4H07_04260 [Nitrosomonadales bacterium]
MMNRTISVFISGVMFLVSTYALAQTQVSVPIQDLVAEQGIKEKKIEGGHKHKNKHKEGKHKERGENKHSNAGEGKLKGLDRADETAGEHGHRDKVHGHD